MKYTYIILASILFVLSSCNQYNSKLEQMGKVAKQALLDFAFDENGDITFYEYKPIKYDSINENILDSFLLEQYLSKALYYHELFDTEYKNFDLETKKIDLDINHIEEIKQEMRRYHDSLNFYRMKNSSLEKQIKLRETPKTIYRLHVYIKASAKHNGIIENTRDTITFLLNDSLQIIHE